MYVCMCVYMFDFDDERPPSNKPQHIHALPPDTTPTTALPPPPPPAPAQPSSRRPGTARDEAEQEEEGEGDMDIPTSEMEEGKGNGKGKEGLLSRSGRVTIEGVPLDADEAAVSALFVCLIPTLSTPTPTDGVSPQTKLSHQ